MENRRSCCTPSCCENKPAPPPISTENSNPGWSAGWLETPAGPVRKINSHLQLEDKLGTIRVRLGIKRNAYRIVPALYAVGNPDKTSPVLVTANYKLTFDALRKELSGLDAWVLVLETKGINVWCAAGKGTFGTQELIARISAVQLPKVVDHNKLILPQLAAPGVAAHQVTAQTGFQVIYGPVYAADIKYFLANNLQATAPMRRIRFSLSDRLAVVPVEAIPVLKLLPVLLALLLIFNLITPYRDGFAHTIRQSLFNLIPFAVAAALGTLGIAALLPYLPFRSFAAKGLILGILWSALVIRHSSFFYLPDNTLIISATAMFILAITTFFSLNFTGSSTYTSLSGVQKETLYTIPLVAIAALIGLGLAITYKIRIFLS